MWAAGDFNETTRDVIQKKLLGGVEWHGDKKGVDGSGMIPRELILQDTITWKAGVPDLVDTVRIKHQARRRVRARPQELPAGPALVPGHRAGSSGPTKSRPRTSITKCSSA
jgi:hypothetical protein